MNQKSDCLTISASLVIFDFNADLDANFNGACNGISMEVLMGAATAPTEALPVRADAAEFSRKPIENSEISTARPIEQSLRKYFDAMSAELGPMSWWPAKTPFEVVVGAILTQNTAWKNVNLALANLRREKLLTPRAIAKISTARLARLIRSSGYFRQKAKKLKAFVKFLDDAYSGSLRKMSAAPTNVLREQLLAVHGIGPETADCILLYAAHHPVFVVDAYTKRLLSRHEFLREDARYDDVQSFFMRNLGNETKFFNEYHALIVNVGKKWCRKHNPLCGECPLGPYLPADSGFRSLVTIAPISSTSEAVQ